MNCCIVFTAQVVAINNTFNNWAELLSLNDDSLDLSFIDVSNHLYFSSVMDYTETTCLVLLTLVIYAELEYNFDKQNLTKTISKLTDALEQELLYNRNVMEILFTKTNTSFVK